MTRKREVDDHLGVRPKSSNAGKALRTVRSAAGATILSAVEIARRTKLATGSAAIPLRAQDPTG